MEIISTRRNDHRNDPKVRNTDNRHVDCYGTRHD